MGRGRGAVLPGMKPQPAPFTTGALVLLRCCPHGEPGRVLGVKRGRILVSWPEPEHYLGRHSPESLVQVAEFNSLEVMSD